MWKRPCLFPGRQKEQGKLRPRTRQFVTALRPEFERRKRLPPGGNFRRNGSVWRWIPGFLYREKHGGESNEYLYQFSSYPTLTRPRFLQPVEEKRMAHRTEQISGRSFRRRSDSSVEKSGGQLNIRLDGIMRAGLGSSLKVKKKLYSIFRKRSGSFLQLPFHSGFVKKNVF